MIGIIAAVMLYTLLVAWSLLGKYVSPDSGYLLIAVPCLIPLGWYSYGYLTAAPEQQDQGLLFSAAGWGLLAIACYIRYSTKAERLIRVPNSPFFQKVTQSADSPTAKLCVAVAIVCLLVGAGLSWYYWQNEAANNR